MSVDTLGAATATSLAAAALAIRLGVSPPVAAPRRRGRAPRRRWRPTPDSPVGGTTARRGRRLVRTLARSLRSGCSLTAAVTAAAATESAMAGIITPGRPSRQPRGLVGRRPRRRSRRSGRVAPAWRSPCCARAPASAGRQPRRSNGPPPRCAPVMPLPPSNWRRAPRRGCPPACSPSYRSPCSYFSRPTDPKVRAAVGTPAGVAVVTLGAVLNLCGALWMRQIIGRPR